MKTKFEKFTMVEVSRRQLKQAPYNPRRIDAKARAKLKEGLADLGLVSPLIWNKRTGHLVAGHQRLAILDDLEAGKDYRLTVSRINVPLESEKRLNLLLNNPEAQGQFDDDMLTALLRDLGTAQNTGFDEDEFAALLRGEDSSHIEKLDPRPLPAMAWVLIGLPTVKFGMAGEALRQLQKIPGIIIEETVNNANG